MNSMMKTALLVLAAIGLATESARGQAMRPYYRVETIKMPAGPNGEVGGLALAPDGRIAACFQSGEVYLIHPETNAWQLFAEGLHDPLGLVVLGKREIVVAQRPELTRLRDTDGDGQADHYETITDEFGLSGNYHEFHFGPAVDADGNFFIGLSTASANADLRQDIRGELRPLGREGRMYSAVPYRGWILKVTPQGKTTPWASGLRAPNGLGFDPQGRLFSIDNQGDWLGTSKLLHIRRDHFYGHPLSLVWRPGFNRHPLSIPVAELDAMRTRAAVQIPHGTMGHSPTQPVWDTTGGRFGPYSGQIFVGEMNQPTLTRLMLEEVDGQVQGACVRFFWNSGLRIGNNRLAFDRAGRLWVGHVEHGWAGDRGIQRLTWTGKVPLDLFSMSLTTKGFELTFTRPLDPQVATQPGSYQFGRYFYEYHEGYGSDRYKAPKQRGIDPVAVTSVHLSDDRRRVMLELENLIADRIYELTLGKLTTADGDPLVNDFAAYTLTRLRK